MIGTVTRAWDWFVSGLAEAVILLANRWTGPPAYRVVIEEGRAAILAPDGAALGKAVETEGLVRLEPDDLLRRRLAGSPIDIMVPPGWLFRRDLDPVAVQSVPFLDAFVRHQIERITPWRAADVHYVVRHVALPADPQRVSVHVSLVPRRLVASWAGAIEGLRPRRLRLLPQGGGEPGAVAITLGTGTPLLRDLKPRIGLALGIAALCLSGLLGWLWWQAGSVRDEIAEQERVLGERKTIMARVHRQDQGERDMNARLRRIRDARRPAVEVIEALAKALPDSAHLTALTLHKTQMTISGISADTSLLVPALERSGPFTGVAFGASITRVEAGPGDRFQLDLSLRDPVPDHPAAPGDPTPAPP